MRGLDAAAILVLTASYAAMSIADLPAWIQFVFVILAILAFVCMHYARNRIQVEADGQDVAIRDLEKAIETLREHALKASDAHTATIRYVEQVHMLARANEDGLENLKLTIWSLP